MKGISFNNDKNGFQNEFDFIRSINGKKVSELDFSMQNFIYDLYEGKINYNTKIYAWKNSEPQKADFYIRMADDDYVKRVSLKKGVKNSVHVEPISEFIHFLIENKVPRDIVIKYLEYHYADGTRNGSGKVRQTAEEYKKDHKQDIDDINSFFNEPRLLKKAIERFVVKGKNSNYEIDVLIYGVPNDFVWIKKKDVYRILLSKKDDYSTAVHFGALTCQPLNRCINRNSLYEKKRYCVQLKWYNLGDDIIENMNYKCMSKSGVSYEIGSFKNP